MNELEWWKLLGQHTRQSPVFAAEAVTAPSPKLPTATSPKFVELPFEEILGTTGAAVGFTAYVWTYPITWIDGPLPVVDAAWAVGLAYSTSRGYRMGKRVGRELDMLQEQLL